MKQQTITRNGVTVSYPVGYATFHDYYCTLHTNMQIIERMKPGTKRDALMASYQQSIKDAEAILDS